MTLIYAKLLLTAVFWGGTFIAGRLLTEHAGPFAGSFLRFAVAGVLLVLVTLRSENGLPAPPRRHLPVLLLMGLTGIFGYNFFFLTGLKTVEAGRASIIIACNPIVIALAAALLFRERLNAFKLAGILISILGAVAVITRGSLDRVLDGGGFGWGELCILGCVGCWVAYSLLGKVVMADLSPLVAVTYSSVVGTLLLLPAALAEGLPLADYAPAAWAAAAYLGVFGTVLGFVWYYQGIRRVGPVRAGLFINFVPISAVLMAFLFLGEPLTASLLVETVMVSAGVALTAVEPGRLRRRPPQV
ncbi:MAG TPA: DMT family transporter [Desulfobacterales bacterium]|nr:DMT family transporter [Desulfobacterales bacterium]